MDVHRGHPELSQRRRRRDQRGADMGVLAEDPSEALAPKTYLRCCSEPVMSDREIADIDLLLQSLSGRGNPKNIAILDNRPVSVRAP
jgi:hypothetical protein